MKYYAVEYGGYWKIQTEDTYEGKDLLDADSVGEEEAEKNAQMIVDLLNNKENLSQPTDVIRDIEEYIWENIPISLSEEDRLENTPNYKTYRFVIEAIKHFGNSPQHKEIVWKDNCHDCSHVDEEGMMCTNIESDLHGEYVYETTLCREFKSITN